MDAPASATRRLLKIAIGVALFDALIAGQGFLAVVVGAVFVVYGLAVWLRRRTRAALAPACAAMAIGLVLAMAVIATVRLNAALAARRGQAVVDAIERYHAERGEYPGRLEQLCPSYLPAVPNACWRLTNAEFVYVVNRGPMLWYVELPPFGRRVYRFDGRGWTGLD